MIPKSHLQCPLVWASRKGLENIGAVTFFVAFLFVFALNRSIVRC